MNLSIVHFVTVMTANAQFTLTEKNVTGAKTIYILMELGLPNPVGLKSGGPFQKSRLRPPQDNMRLLECESMMLLILILDNKNEYSMKIF